jgi:hypothetical protein
MEDSSTVFLLLGVILRIVGALVCFNKAVTLNRNSGGWGLFGFMAPIIAMIWIQFMRPIMEWDKNVPLDNKSKE